MAANNTEAERAETVINSDQSMLIRFWFALMGEWETLCEPHCRCPSFAFLVTAVGRY